MHTMDAILRVNARVPFTGSRLSIVVLFNFFFFFVVAAVDFYAVDADNVKVFTRKV